VLRAGSKNDLAGTWRLARTRILLANLPRWRRELVAAILARETDMEVVAGGSAAPEAFARTAKDKHFDVVVIGQDDEEIAAMLLERAPRAKVLAVTAEGGHACLYELRPRRMSLGDVSAAQLVDAIRSAARRERP
jgi:DNA-binding NarL/FixJ family response regulator